MPVYADPADGIVVAVAPLEAWTRAVLERLSTPADVAANVATVLLASDRRGIVLIFDEVITGLRVGMSGAQGLLGVTPDLTIIAKALGAGFPIAGLVGNGAGLAVPCDFWLLLR